MSISVKNRAQKLYVQASNALAKDIRAGALKQPMRLTETLISERFGISRAPARQALAELETQGLIRKAEGRGYDVIAYSSNQFSEADHSEDLSVELQPTSSWQLIYPQIELEIVSRTALASWRINEVLLARHYEVSRTVARDVVARLQERGIIRKDSSARWYAPALTQNHIEELYELRWVLEPLALAKAAPLLPEGHLKMLRLHLETAIETPQASSEQLDRLEQELHVELLGHCGNQALLRAVHLPQALLVAHHFLYRQTAEMFESEPFLPEHLAVIRCLEQSDVPSACQALVHHLQVSRHRAMLRINAVARSIQPAALPYLEQL